MELLPTMPVAPGMPTSIVIFVSPFPPFPLRAVVIKKKADAVFGRSAADDSL